MLIQFFLNIRNLLACFILLIPGIKNVYSQSDDILAEGLQEMGFENIRVLHEEENVYISVENNVYRWDVSAVAEALDIISSGLNEPAEIQMLIVRKDIPYCLVKVKAKEWTDFRIGNLDKAQFDENFEITSETREVWLKLKNKEPLNPNNNKFDLIVYPEFAFRNTKLAKIYETQLNIAPALAFSLWKGNQVTGQVIVPLHNELGYEADFIRPGFLTIEQDFRPFDMWWGILSVGNFSNNRYGVALSFRHPFKNENWVFESNVAYTGSSHFFDKKWIHSPVNKFTCMASASWYCNRFDLAFKGGVYQYIYGDKGLTAGVTRFFGETAIGFYAQLNEKNNNAGVDITIPFPIKKRKQRNYINLIIPDHVDYTYDAGTELFYGQFFRTNASINKIKNSNFTSLMKKNVVNEQIH